MITTQQLEAAHTFLAACAPANALQQKPPMQSQRTWQDQLQAAQAARRAAHTAMQDLCGSRTVYQEAIAAAQASNKVG